MDLEFIRYCRNKGSAFGHSAKKKDIENAWKLTKEFLEKYTEFDLATQPRIELWNSSPEIMDFLLSKIKNKYGETDTSSGTPYKWLLPKILDEELLKLAFLNKRYENHSVGPLCVYFTFDFNWKGVSSSVNDKYSGVYSQFNRGKHGSFSISIGSRLFIQPDFVIPFSLETKEARNFIDNLRADLPYKLSDSSLVCFREKALKSGKIRYKSYGTYKSLTKQTIPPSA